MTNTAAAATIRSYYARNARKGQWVALADLAENLDIADMAGALRELYRAGDVNIIAEENQRFLTDRQREHAVQLFGRKVHLLSID